jgi:hypothetical protein
MKSVKIVLQLDTLSARMKLANLIGKGLNQERIPGHDLKIVK